jgi:hypothetical protein
MEDPENEKGIFIHQSRSGIPRPTASTWSIATARPKLMPLEAQQ